MKNACKMTDEQLAMSLLRKIQNGEEVPFVTMLPSASQGLGFKNGRAITDSIRGPGALPTLDDKFFAQNKDLLAMEINSKSPFYAQLRPMGFKTGSTLKDFVVEAVGTVKDTLAKLGDLQHVKDKVGAAQKAGRNLSRLNARTAVDPYAKDVQEWYIAEALAARRFGGVSVDDAYKLNPITQQEMDDYYGAMVGIVKRYQKFASNDSSTAWDTLLTNIVPVVKSAYDSGLNAIPKKKSQIADYPVEPDRHALGISGEEHAKLMDDWKRGRDEWQTKKDEERPTLTREESIIKLSKKVLGERASLIPNKAYEYLGKMLDIRINNKAFEAEDFNVEAMVEELRASIEYKMKGGGLRYPKRDQKGVYAVMELLAPHLFEGPGSGIALRDPSKQARYNSFKTKLEFTYAFLNKLDKLKAGKVSASELAKDISNSSWYAKNSIAMEAEYYAERVYAGLVNGKSVGKGSKAADVSDVTSVANMSAQEVKAIYEKIEPNGDITQFSSTKFNKSTGVYESTINAAQLKLAVLSSQFSKAVEAKKSTTHITTQIKEVMSKAKYSEADINSYLLSLGRAKDIKTTTKPKEPKKTGSESFMDFGLE